MNRNSNWPDFPRFIIADPPRVSTIKSPVDGEDGLAVFWSKAAAKRVARTNRGTVVVEVTPQMFVEAIHKANEMGVPWLYIGNERDGRVYFERVRLTVAQGQYARDGQHRHGEESC